MDIKSLMANVQQMRKTKVEEPDEK
jgi:hypothetical protein